MILSIIIVTFNSKAIIKECLNSVFASVSDISFEVIIVDNASQDGTAQAIRNDFPQVKAIENTKNLGFAGANNIGIAASSGRYILVLNPDTVLKHDSIAILLACLDNNPHVALASCKLLYPDGALQYSIRNFPNLTNQLFESCLLHRIFPQLTVKFGEVIYERALYERNNEVDWVSGAAMLIRKDALDGQPFFDERFFLYSEETDLCRRLRNKGWSVAYEPSAQIIHHHGDTANPELFLQQAKSRLLYFEKHKPSYQLIFLRSIMAFSYILRIMPAISLHVRKLESKQKLKVMRMALMLVLKPNNVFK